MVCQGSCTCDVKKIRERSYYKCPPLYGRVHRSTVLRESFRRLPRAYVRSSSCLSRAVYLLFLFLNVLTKCIAQIKIAGVLDKSART